MRSENYVAFFIICGFFIGIIFSMVKIDTASGFLFSTLAITLFFYLFIHIVLIFFLSAKEAEDKYFDKHEYETSVNSQIAEIKKREELITAILKSIYENDGYKKKEIRVDEQ